MAASQVSPSWRSWRSFWAVPLVAAAAWYVLMLIALLAVNGRLRWRTDVLAMALGAVLLGLPTAGVITVALAIPAYLIARRVGQITASIAVAAGAIIGLAVWVLVAGTTGESTVLSPLRASLIGMVSAGVWWYTGGRDES
jgi:hypothetical protein